MQYPRDLIGYGDKPPRVRWPGNARVALNFVLNYEEGGEKRIDGELFARTQKGETAVSGSFTAALPSRG